MSTWGSGGSSFKMYIESIMKVTSETFYKWVNRLPVTTTDRNIVQPSVQIVPTLFCAMLYVNNGRHLPKNEAPGYERLQSERKILRSIR